MLTPGTHTRRQLQCPRRQWRRRCHPTCSTTPPAPAAAFVEAAAAGFIGAASAEANDSAQTATAAASIPLVLFIFDSPWVRRAELNTLTLIAVPYRKRRSSLNAQDSRRAWQTKRATSALDGLECRRTPAEEFRHRARSPRSTISRDIKRTC